MITSLVILTLISCRKSSSDLDQTSINLADDDAVSEAVFEDVFSTIDDATILLDDAIKAGGTKSVVLSEGICPEITVTHPADGIWPKVVTIDYGTGCTGFNDNTRSGKIIIEVTGPRREAGSKRTVTFDDYYFNGIKVEGTKEFENLGLNASNNFVLSISLIEGRLILPDGKSIERTTDHQKEWIAGFMTPDRWDDECLITGTASGKNAAGTLYSTSIISPLHWKRVCRFIVSGVTEITREGAEPFLLDYGTGECDNKAVVTRDGESREISLRHRHRLFANN